MTQFTIQLDQSTYQPGATCRRHLIASVAAPEPAALAERTPLDLALVIDTSGSMAQGRLEYAKRAAAGVVEALLPEDRLTVVAFESNVHVLVDNLPMEGTGRDRALDAIGQLQTMGRTNLSGGWLAGGAILADAASEASERRRQIVLLSDGHANEGIVEPDLLATEARRLLERGVPTSCVGVGNGYSTIQLEAIADFGGGRLHDAELPQEIAEVIAGELCGLINVAVQSADLVLALPEGVRGENLAGGATSMDGATPTFHFGAIQGGATRSLVVRLHLDDGAAFEGTLPVHATLSWTAPDAAKEVLTETATAALTMDAAEPAPVRREHAQSVVSAWQAGLTRRITMLNRDGRYGQIYKLQPTELRWLEAYTADHPILAQAVHRMAHLMHRAARPMQERTRKDAYLMMKKGIRVEPEYRAKYAHADLTSDFATAEAELDRILRADPS